jgi:hypothetical protein
MRRMTLAKSAAPNIVILGMKHDSEIRQALDDAFRQLGERRRAMAGSISVGCSPNSTALVVPESVTSWSIGRRLPGPSRSRAALFHVREDQTRFWLHTTGRKATMSEWWNAALAA